MTALNSLDSCYNVAHMLMRKHPDINPAETSQFIKSVQEKYARIVSSWWIKSRSTLCKWGPDRDFVKEIWPIVSLLKSVTSFNPNIGEYDLKHA